VKLKDVLCVYVRLIHKTVSPLLLGTADSGVTLRMTVRCSGKFVALENYSHTQQYGLGLRLRIGLNLRLGLGVG